jgi:AraC-like DNA-binding protein
MKQQNINLRSSPSKNSGTAVDPNQRKIETAQNRPVGYTSKIEDRSSQAKTQELLTNVIGAHRICPILFSKGYANDPVTDSRFHTHHLSTGNFDLIELQWQGAFQLEQDPLAARYVIYLVLAGSLEQKINQHQIFCCSPDTATIVNPCQKLESIASREGKALLISIDRDSIDSALSKLLVGGASGKGNRPLKQPVVFLNSIDLTSELGLSLKKFVQFLWEAAAENHLADFSALVLAKLEQAFLACSIEGLPSNYSEELLYQQDGAFACHVRKARVFIESNLQEDIKLGDIAAATGVCSRLLQKAFSLHCGCSPMRFVTRSRLQQIRQELDRSTTDTKIVDVMMDYGFTQGGKFAKEYQQLFGEKPSDTLKRSSQFNQGNSPLWQQIDDARSDRIVGGRSMLSFPNYAKYDLILP